jgi:hypothetical protein
LAPDFLVVELLAMTLGGMLIDIQKHWKNQNFFVAVHHPGMVRP